MKTQVIELQENMQVYAREDTQFVLVFPNEKSVKLELNIIFEKEGVAAEIIGLYKLSKDQSVDLTTVATHKVPHTSCMTKIKGVLMDRARSKYTGKIVIEKAAQGTSSFLEHNVLVLGDETHNNSEPILEILANDVMASHGATTGRINEDQIYYLTSRGLSRVEAEELIVEGFLKS